MMDQWIPTSYLHEAETQGTGGLDKEELKMHRNKSNNWENRK